MCHSLNLQRLLLSDIFKHNFSTLWKGIIYYDKDCHGGSKTKRACSVLGIRERFRMKLNLGELCKGYEWDMNCEMRHSCQGTV